MLLSKGDKREVYARHLAAKQARQLIRNAAGVCVSCGDPDQKRTKRRAMWLARLVERELEDERTKTERERLLREMDARSLAKRKAKEAVNEA